MNNLLPMHGPALYRARTTRFRAALAASPLVVVGDSDPHTRRVVAALLSRKGYRVRVQNSALGLLRELAARRGDMDCPEFIVLGVVAGDREVLDYLGALDLAYDVPPAIVLVPPDDAGLRKAARAHGAAMVIERPRAVAVLTAAVADATPFAWALED